MTKIKDIRAQMKFRMDETRHVLDKIGRTMIAHPERDVKFRESVYFVLKYKCGKTMPANVDEAARTHPAIHKLNEKLIAHDARIDKLDNELTIMIDAYKSKLSNIQRTMRSAPKSDKPDMRKIVKDMRQSHARTVKHIKANTYKEKRELRGDKQYIKKQLKHTLKNVNKELIKDKKKREKQAKKDAKIDAARAQKELNAFRQMNDTRTEFADGKINDLVKKYTTNVKIEMVGILETQEAKAAETRKRKEAKAAETRKRKEAKAAETRKRKEAKAEDL
jgi:hypothetical protein